MNSARETISKMSIAKSNSKISLNKRNPSKSTMVITINPILKLSNLTFYDPSPSIPRSSTSNSRITIQINSTLIKFLSFIWSLNFKPKSINSTKETLK